MSITVGTLTFSRYQAFPVSWETLDVPQGLAARAWQLDVLLTAAEGLQLSQIFDTWRASRITEPDALEADSVGTTVALTGTIGGYSWSNVGCWFTSPPSFGAGNSMWQQASFTLVDAAQMLAALRRQQELEDAAESSDESEIDYGTLVVGGVTLTLLQPADGYTDGPTATATATGTDLIEGSLYAWRIQSVRGWTNQAGWDTIFAWYPTAIAVLPASGTWFPVTPPSLDRDIVSIDGVETERWIVSIDLRRIR